MVVTNFSGMLGEMYDEAELDELLDDAEMRQDLAEMFDEEFNSWVDSIESETENAVR